MSFQLYTQTSDGGSRGTPLQQQGPLICPIRLLKDRVEQQLHDEESTATGETLRELPWSSIRPLKNFITPFFADTAHAKDRQKRFLLGRGNLSAAFRTKSAKRRSSLQPLAGSLQNFYIGSQKEPSVLQPVLTPSRQLYSHGMWSMLVSCPSHRSPESIQDRSSVFVRQEPRDKGDYNCPTNKQQPWRMQEWSRCYVSIVSATRDILYRNLALSSATALHGILTRSSSVSE